MREKCLITIIMLYYGYVLYNIKKDIKYTSFKLSSHYKCQDEKKINLTNKYVISMSQLTPTPWR